MEIGRIINHQPTIIRMVYLIKTQERRELDLIILRDSVLEALGDLNRDRGTNFRTTPIDPTLLESKQGHDTWKIGNFEYGQGKLKTYDSLLAFRVSSLGGLGDILNRDIALFLITTLGTKPRWIVLPGYGDTCPATEEGIFYENPSNDGKFNAFLIARNIIKRDTETGVPSIDKLWYCCSNPEKGYDVKQLF